ncbi:UDP-N-acetylmuramoyl-L-alanine--D-glutamate ligase [bacterium]|nr:UDP-N-acetylmuramoyl-L-alanine--D-glutamate ligase [bacterium]
MSKKIAADYKNKNVLVLGLARSGLAALELLAKKGANIVGADEKKDISIPDRFKSSNIQLGPFSFGLLENCDEIVLSPGIRSNHPIITEALNKSIPVISELELGYRFATAKIIALTGTNGKSTTVTMIERILTESGYAAIAAGNIGNPFCAVTEELTREGIFVLEVSSFQLEMISGFKPDVTGILNMTPDHLDRYDSVEDYYMAKEKITVNNDSKDTFFYNADDNRCSQVAARFEGGVVPFSSSIRLDDGIFLDGDNIVQAAGGEIKQEIMKTTDLKVVGSHNVENAMAAIASVQGWGCSAESCKKALSVFEGLKHRMERVRKIEGVEYFNDSKATNVEATVKSLIGLDCRIVLIAGGLDKGSDFKMLLSLNLMHVVLIGSAAGLIEKALFGVVPLSHAKTMEEAVQKAHDVSLPGSCVVLSPACASFDMFTDFRHRGNLFVDSVNKLGVG